MPEKALAEDRRLNRKMRSFGWILLVIAVVIAVWGVASRIVARDALAKDTADSAIQTVIIVKAKPSDKGEQLVLPGAVQAYIEAPIYARTNGYLRSWSTDIGSEVHKGQLLAEIESPEVDQQLVQALADLATARANEALARTTNERWQGLLATESVSKQDADQKAGDAAARKAASDSAAANVARLRDLESFKRVLAPFDGVITARNTDIGALINAGQNAGAELFRIADTHKLRVYVRVPQTYAAATRPGIEAELHFAEHPSTTFMAKTVRTSNALDPTLRTLQVELELDNEKKELFPGAYAEVHFNLGHDTATLRLPANTVLFRSQGLQVATVDAQHRVHLKSIVQGRDFGSSIEVLSGITEQESVIVNPPDSLTDGLEVKAMPPPDKDKKS